MSDNSAQVTSLPKAFKFKSTNDLKADARFILLLVELGFQTVGSKERFLSDWVLSGNVYAYAIEDNEIKILLKNGNEECYAKDELPEIAIRHYDASVNPLPESTNTLADNKEIIDRTAKALLEVDVTKITPEDVAAIEIFRAQVARMG